MSNNVITFNLLQQQKLVALNHSQKENVEWNIFALAAHYFIACID